MGAAGSAGAPSVSLCAQARGVNTPSGVTKRVIHASAAVPARDRRRLQRLCRYAARPPLAQERLTELPDGRLRLELKRAWADGTTAIVLSPEDLIARLCAAVPPPRFHLTRFAGVLAAHCTLRPLVVPQSPPQPAPDTTRQAQLPLFEPAELTSVPAKLPRADHDEPAARRYKGRHPWALLLRHVFAVDVEQCAQCQGRMRLVELCTTAEAAQRVLRHAGGGPPPRAPPQRPVVQQTQLPLPLHAG